MIRLERLNGEVLYLSIFQILFLEKIPETKVKLANGDFYLVKDSIESINAQIQRFFHGCLTPDKEMDEEALAGQIPNQG
ncbi:MAG: flagellar FlbD family protein [Lachnospiraceae bacterium]|jgi:flagellar protein FlbD|nr:flagellar FlbD family protein [Lachnospiraceae bacterium]MCH4028483.1 flagellar FlbD family protein [Lachnospiraceae bacterium]MCH4066333.1 flagellar FlbD family protein [Lachnospiraceae bacterium]MCH4112363.1 flagellar FlbD family protein [Lachnospiraceae bacterium]MCI1353342.1 flagellar FlbD family protein [Lachnospiraceae bacterium]